MTVPLVEEEEAAYDPINDIVVGAIIPMPVMLGGGFDWAVLQVRDLRAGAHGNMFSYTPRKKSV